MVRPGVGLASPTPAEGVGDASSWGRVIAEKQVFRGGAQIAAPPGEITLRHPGGGKTPVARDAQGRIELPSFNGAPFVLEAQTGGRVLTSPSFSLDSNPPRLKILEAVSGEETVTAERGALVLRWFAHDDEDGEAPTVVLHLRAEKEWEDRVLPTGG